MTSIVTNILKITRQAGIPVVRFCILMFLLISGGAVLYGQIQTSVPSLTGFIQTDAIPCPIQSYVVSGSNISADVVITAPAGFEISTDQVNWFAPPNSITIGQNGPTTIPTTTISVRLNTPTLGTYTGNISHTSTDAASVFLGVSGIRSSKSPTTTNLLSSLNPSIFGQSLTLTANVTSPMPGTPTGTVTFYDGGSPLGTVALDLSATASLSTSGLTFGSHNLTTTYNANATFDTSTSFIVNQLVRGTTTTVVVSNNNPSVSGQSVTFTATVSSSFTGTPTGFVTFFDGVSSLGSAALSGGSAAISTSALTPGAHSITATYNGDPLFAGSTSAVLSQMVKATTTTLLLSDHNPSVSGQLVTLTANVGSITPGTITGTVTFFDGITALGLPVTLSAGSAQYTVSYPASASTRSFTATFNGDPNYAVSTSSVLSQTINKSATATVISADHNPSAVGQAVTFTATVSPLSPGSGTPSGSVTINIDGSPVGPIPMIGGMATTTTSSLALGTHVVTGSYAGDGDFTSSSSLSYADSVDPVITATAGPNGSISPSGAVLAPYGGNQIFTITPAIGYQVDSLFIDGVAKAGAERDTFFNVLTNHTIHATFIVKTFNVTVSVSPNGTASPLGIVAVLRGDSLVVNFSADAHYHVSDILVDGFSVGPAASYTLRNVLAEHTVHATFTVDIYTITAAAGANGSISPSGDVPVTYNTDQSFSITPNAHYEVDSVVVDGTSVGAVTGYTFSAVATDHTIAAYFKLMSQYAVQYRTFTYDSLIVKKAISKKPVTQYWEFTITNTSSSDVTEVNLVLGKDVKEFISASSGFSPSGLKKAWKFTGGTLHHLDALVIKGRSLRPGAQQIAKLYFGPVTRIPTAKSLNPDRQWAELPMPNTASVRDLAFIQAGFPSAPWIIGKAIPESIKVYGWVALKKSNDMYKSLFDRTAHSVIGKGFDLIGTRPFVKQQPSLPPSKHNNKTFADLLTFKFNILLSQLGITTRGFGELRLSQPASPFHGMLLREVAHFGDSMMTCHDDFAGNPGLYFSLDSLLTGLNSAFSGPTDTVHWADSMRLTGMARLQDVPYLSVSGIPPMIIPVQPDFDLLTERPVPEEILLSQNYPNPFNPTTIISFELMEPAVVTLNVYNMLGQEVAKLIDRVWMEDGEQEAEFNAGNLASGIYFYRLQAHEINSSRSYMKISKMMLIK